MSDLTEQLRRAAGPLAPRPLSVDLRSVGGKPTVEEFFDLIAPEKFATSLELTRRQRSAERGAKTDLARMEREFRQVGRHEEFKEFLENEGRVGAISTTDLAMRNVVDPLFDMLSVGNYTTAGLAQEALRTGSVWEGFKQAAVEFGNALPGFEVEGARKPSFIDIMAEQGQSNWGGWTAGLALDILLDPLNVIPGVGAGRLETKIGRALRKTPAGKLLDFLFTPNRKVVQVGEQGERVLELSKKYENLSEAESVVMADRVQSMLAWMQPHERRLFGTWMDQPKALERELYGMVSGGLLEASRVPKLLEMVEKVILPHTDELLRTDIQSGIMDEWMSRDFYVHGMEALSPRVRRAQEKIIRERRPGAAAGMLPIGRVMPAAQARTTANQEERMAKSLMGEIDYTTEPDIGNILLKRSVDTVRWSNWRKFLDAVVSDGKISAKVIDFDFGNPVAWDIEKNRILEGYSGYDVLEIKKKVKIADPADPDVSVGAVNKVVGAYVLPKPIVEYVTRAEAALRDSSDTGRFLEFVEQLTGAWRGWATFGVGYHLRNDTTAALTNWITGVGTDYTELLKGRWPVPGGFLLKHLQAVKLQSIANGVGRLPKVVKERLDVLAVKAGYSDLANVPHPKIKNPEGKPMTWGEVAALGEAHGVPQHVSKLYNISEENVTRFYTEIDNSVPLEKLEAAPVSQLTKEVLKLGRDEPRTWGERFSKWFGNENPALNAHRTLGQISENTFRWALFLDRLEKGAGPAEAAAATKLWHFDYRNLTDIEKRMFRVVLPFYAWTRYAAPRMLFAMIENPGRFSKIPKVKAAIERLSESWGEIPTPDYFDEVQAIQLPLLHRDKPLFAQLDSPLQELNHLNWKNVMSSLHPFAKVITETMPEGGYSFFTEAPIEKFAGEEGPSGLRKMTEAQITNLFPPAGKFVFRPLRAIERGEEHELILSELTGIKFRAVDVRRVLRGRLFERRKLARDFKEKLRQEGVLQ